MTIADARRESLSWSGLRSAAGVLCFVVVPLVVTALVALVAARHGLFAANFHTSFWTAGDRLLHGRSLYEASASDIASGIGFPYSSLTGLILVPFALLPVALADAIAVIASIIALVLSLRVLNVTDYRVYGAALLWVPVISAWQLSNFTLILGLGIALLWHHRDRPVVSGILFAVLVSLKVIVWPLGIWLLATRRYAALWWAIAYGLVLNLAAWAVVGFSEVSAYWQLSKAVTRVQELKSYNMVAFGQLHGMARASAYGLQLVLATVVTVYCVALGRRHRTEASLVVSVALCLLFAPVVHLHYLALLVIPLAIVRPRLGAVWLLPIVMFAPMALYPRFDFQIVLATAVAVVAGAIRQSPRSPVSTTNEIGAVAVES